jgi:hypothetical protein
VTFLIYIQLFIIAALLHVEHYIPVRVNDSKVEKYLKLSLFMSPIFFVLYFGVKEERLIALREKLGYKHFDKEITHRVLLFTYLFLSLLALFALAIMRKG